MSIFIPEEDETYYYIGCEGSVVSEVFNKLSTIDSHNLAIGNCYRTEEDAVIARNSQYAKRELEVFLNEEYPTGSFVMYRTLDSLFNTMTIGIKIKDSMYAKCLEKLGEAKLRLILEVE